MPRADNRLQLFNIMAVKVQSLAYEEYLQIL